MSVMIECDSCKKKMYADVNGKSVYSSKQGKEYHEILIDKEIVYHVCDKCYLKILQSHLPEAHEYVLSIREDV